MKHNPQQKLAINALGKNVIVSASAGAGKTTVLISRLMKRIIEDRVQVNQICAMTFTEKAAAEMKKRLNVQLNEAFSKNPTDTYLYSQLQQLQTAQISTIHSFCLSVISEFGYLIGFDPKRATNILSDDALSALKKQAIDEVFEHYYADASPTFLNLASFFSTRPLNVDEFQKAIQSLYEQSQIQLDASEWLDNLIIPFQAHSLFELPTAYQDIFTNLLLAKVDTLQEKLEHMRNVFLDETENQKEAIYNKMNELEEALIDLRKAIVSKDLSEVAQAAKIAFNITFTHINKEVAFNQARKDYFDTYGDLDVFFYNEDFTVVNPQQLPYIQLLIDLTKQYGKRFESLKLEHQGIDFNDIEHYAYLILSGDSDLARETLKERYAEILVDEFQDSNLYQEAIVNLISRGNNVFRVGDVKQSIYGFRHAKPDIMRNLMNNENGDQEVLYLSNNFRSKDTIVQFNNEVFKRAMNIDSFKDTYTDKDEVTIGRDEQAQDNVPVKIHLLETGQTLIKLDEDDEESEESLKNAQLVATYIAQDIKRQVTSGKQYRDVCILIRTHDRKKQLKKAFDEQGIPYYFDSREGFTHAYSVQDVLQLINLLLNMEDEFYLTYVLLSGFGGYDENDITRLRLHSKAPLLKNLRETNGRLYNRLVVLSDEFIKSEMIDGIKLIYNFNDYYHAHLPIEEKSNLDMLFEKIVDYESKPNEGWVGYLNHVETIQESKDQSNSASSVDENANVVSVLTIHQSKGLQFPVVYYYPNTKLSVQSMSGPLIIDADLGVSLFHFDPQELSKRQHLIRKCIEQKIILDEVEENLRLLYVALTRAQDELHLVDITPTRNADDPITSASLLAKEGHTLSVLRSLSGASEQLYEIINPEIGKIRYLTAADKTPTSFTIEKKSKVKQPETLPLFEPRLDMSGGVKATQKGSLLHYIVGTWPNYHFEPKFLDTFELSLLEKEQLMAYRSHEMTKKLMKLSPEFEVGYAYNHEGNLEVGIMDMLARSENELYLIDFKSDRVSDGSVLIERYRPQIERYQRVLAKKYPGQRILSYLYSFVLNEYIALD